MAFVEDYIEDMRRNIHFLYFSSQRTYLAECNVSVSKCLSYNLFLFTLN